jgi:general secretion pathway protein G
MRQRGFTLIELLIAVAIIGIVAAIAIPNMLDAMERTRQKSTTAEVKELAAAMQSFEIDYKGYPNMAHNGALPTVWVFNDAKGQPAIIPEYIQAVKSYDGWRRPYWYLCGPDTILANVTLGQTTSAHFTISSMGSDGNPGGGTDPGVGDAAAMYFAWCVLHPVALGTVQTHCYQSDIVWADSAFLQSPTGKQKKC